MSEFQRTDEWKIDRCGKVTASRIADVMAKIKSGEAAARADYRAQIVAELISGRPQENGYVSMEMLNGIEQEDFARAAYELERGVLVEEVGFIDHQTIEMAGASPDGLVEDDGLVEIKCPKLKTHISYVLSGSIPSRYVMQMQWQMACTGRKWCDFVSYNPSCQLVPIYILRVERDEKMIDELEKEVKKFLSEVMQDVQGLLDVADKIRKAKLTGMWNHAED